MRIRALNIFVFVLFSTFSSIAGDHFSEGTKLFNTQKYGEAISVLNKEVTDRPTNASAWFNLGLSYNAQKNYAKAIWAFEKVLKLKPNDNEALESLQISYEHLNGSEYAPTLNYFERSMYSKTSRFWAFLGIGFSILAAFCIIFFRKSNVIPRKRLFLGLSFFPLIFIGFTLYIAAGAYKHETSIYGLVTAPKIETFQKGEKEPSGIELPVGTKVKILSGKRAKNTLLEVQTNDRKTYLVHHDAVDRI